MNSLKNRNNFTLLDFYNKLFESFGQQGWWPGDTKFEILVGAILTQNTSWKNVEKSISLLKSKNLLTFEKMAEMKREDLAELIRSSGFYNQKAERLNNLLNSIKSRYGSDENFFVADPDEAREFLLSQKGIGKETADSIILYAMDKPVFVVDKYTFRIFRRFGFKVHDDYDTIRKEIENIFNGDVNRLKELHALIVELGKRYCKKIPQCDGCPLNKMCEKNI